MKTSSDKNIFQHSLVYIVLISFFAPPCATYAQLSPTPIEITDDVHAGRLVGPTEVELISLSMDKESPVVSDSEKNEALTKDIMDSITQEKSNAVSDKTSIEQVVERIVIRLDDVETQQLVKEPHAKRQVLSNSKPVVKDEKSAFGAAAKASTDNDAPQVQVAASGEPASTMTKPVVTSGDKKVTTPSPPQSKSDSTSTVQGWGAPGSANSITIRLPERIPAECVVNAASRYQVPEMALLAIMKQESGGRTGIVATNTNGSKDYGPAQFNDQSWGAYMSKKYGITLDMITNNMCQALMAQAYAVRSLWNSCIVKGNTSIWCAIANYHSSTPKYQQIYISNVWKRYQNMVAQGQF